MTVIHMFCVHHAIHELTFLVTMLTIIFSAQRSQCSCSICLFWKLMSFNKKVKEESSHPMSWHAKQIMFNYISEKYKFCYYNIYRCHSFRLLCPFYFSATWYEIFIYLANQQEVRKKISVEPLSYRYWIMWVSNKKIVKISQFEGCSITVCT